MEVNNDGTLNTDGIPGVQAAGVRMTHQPKIFGCCPLPRMPERLARALDSFLGRQPPGRAGPQQQGDTETNGNGGTVRIDLVNLSGVAPSVFANQTNAKDVVALRDSDSRKDEKVDNSGGGGGGASSSSRATDTPKASAEEVSAAQDAIKALHTCLDQKSVLDDAQAAALFGQFDSLTSAPLKAEIERRIHDELSESAKSITSGRGGTMLDKLDDMLNHRMRCWPPKYKLMAVDAFATHIATCRDVLPGPAAAAFDKLLAYDNAVPPGAMTVTQLYGAPTEATKQGFQDFIEQAGNRQDEVFVSISLRAAAWGATMLMPAKDRGVLDDVLSKATKLSPRHRQSVKQVVADNVRFFGTPEVNAARSAVAALHKRLAPYSILDSTQAPTLFGPFDSLSSAPLQAEFERRIHDELDEWAKLLTSDPDDRVDNLDAKLLQITYWPRKYKLMALDVLATQIATGRDVGRGTAAAAFDKLLAYDDAAPPDAMTVTQFYNDLPPLASAAEAFRSGGSQAFLTEAVRALSPEQTAATKQVFLNFIEQAGNRQDEVFVSILLRAAAWGATMCMLSKDRGVLDDVLSKAAPLSPRHRQSVEQVVLDSLNFHHPSGGVFDQVEQYANLLELTRTRRSL